MDVEQQRTMTDQLIDITIAGKKLQVSTELLARYNRPGPRYTSYPTAPEWDDAFGPEDFRAAIADSNLAPRPTPLSLYFHIPFCQSLCLYCGCNVVINKNHDVARGYLERLKREIDAIASVVAPNRLVEQIHWGGGTPTYLSAEQIDDLYTYVADRFPIAPDAEISLEVEPRVTTDMQCDTLRRLGFNRLSMGVQDFDPLVQETIRRIQPYDMTRRLYDHCRSLGFDSINLDLIYGLPHQTRESFRDTVEKVIEMSPDRIALFSYAHVPWLKKQQGSFARHLPDPVEKFRIFAMAIDRFTEAGYRYIGMDHFVRPGDELARAQDDRTLHRNFQGYTTRAGCDLIGMGVTSISALDGAYAQNQRDLSQYYDAIDNGRWPTMRGINVTPTDKLRRDVINRILCHCVVVKSEIEDDYGIDFDWYFADALDSLRELVDDGLVQLGPDRIEVLPLGRIFIRNIAMAFDAYLNKPATEGRVFSNTL
jgi:oxygen-independent coproporphyrinogen-3 oxidase